MLSAIYIYMLCESLLPTNGWLSYKVYRSARNPNNLKLKIDGDIYLGEELSQSPQTRSEGNAFKTGLNNEDTILQNTLENATDKVTDATTEDASVNDEDEQGKQTPEQEEDKNAAYNEEDEQGKQTPEQEEDKSAAYNVEDEQGKHKTPENGTAADSEQSSLRNQLKSLAILDAYKADNDKIVTKSKEKGNTSELRILKGNASFANGTSAKHGKTAVNKSNNNTFNGQGEYNTKAKLQLRYEEKHKVTKGTGVTQISQNLNQNKVLDDVRIKKFTDHVFRQALKALGQIKQHCDPDTQKEIVSLVQSYKKKFSDFVKKTRETEIKTSQGTQNVILHTLDTSNLMLKRITNYLKSDVFFDDAKMLREGGVLRMDKEIDTVKETEYQHACKKFGVCHTTQGFRTALQDIILILLQLPDRKLTQVNDAATEALRDFDFASVADSLSALYVLNRALRTQERINSKTLRNNLLILYGAIAKSHLPLIIQRHNYNAKPAVQRTVAFRKLLNELEAALPPTETNRSEWGLVRDRLNRWKDDAPLDIQEIMHLFFKNVERGIANNNREIKRLVEELAESNASIGDW